ncbi:MAG: DUF5667 domain-containing protein [Patescibacteria group bacterium]
MENLEKLLSALPKNKLSRRADIKIKFSLYRLILQNKLARFFDFSAWRLVTMHKALAFAVFVFLVLGTTSFYAYASGDVLPGSQLYPVKIALEKIEQTITVTNSAKISNLQKVSERRLSEAVSLSEKEQATIQESQRINEDIKNNIAIGVNNHEAIAKHINNLSNSPKAQSLINEAETNDQKEMDYLDQIAAFAAESNNEDILQNVQAAKESIGNQKYNEDNKRRQNQEKMDTEEINTEKVDEEKEIEPQGGVASTTNDVNNKNEMRQRGRDRGND